MRQTELKQITALGSSSRETLTMGEVFWRDHRDWLQTKGYVLRARYQDGWIPSWRGTDLWPNDLEDGIRPPRASVLDATHVEDGAFVMMKRISKTRHPFEVDIGTWFSAEPQRSDPENHCVPIREVLQSPHDSDSQIIVMPLLQAFDKPRFDSIGETVAFFKQVFEGLRYMHKHHVAHRDCAYLNIMMDASPLYSEPVHPFDIRRKRDWSGRISHRSRTERPVKYYITDFGISRRYRAEDLPVLEPPIIGADKSVPEFQVKSKYDDLPDLDPFPTDVYYLGNLIRQDFTGGDSIKRPKLGFEFMELLVADMVNKDPTKRPTMDEVVYRFDEIVRGLSAWKLRSEVSKAAQRLRFVYTLKHWILKVRLIAGQYPPIPVPP
ncbi:kinase-like domain-containing protein [Mycena filopes]|nr:kinase-like domain-containing protein [Mycena filopes]